MEGNSRGQPEKEHEIETNQKIEPTDSITEEEEFVDTLNSTLLLETDINTMTESKITQVERYSRILSTLEEDPQSLEIFIRRAETLHSVLPDDDAKKIFLNCVKNCTTGNTYSDIASLETWPEVRDELRVMLLPQKSISQLYIELASIRKFSGEPIVEFTVRIKKIVNALKNAHKQSDTTAAEAAWVKVFEMIDSQALNSFVQGLGTQMKNWVMARDFKTLKSASDYAQGLEYTDKEMFQSTDMQRPICTFCGKMGHNEEKCFKRQSTERGGYFSGNE